MKDKLSWCNRCKEFSVRRKAYTRNDGVHRRLEYCLNKNCSYREIFPDTPKIRMLSRNWFRSLYENTVGEWRIRLMLRKFYREMEAKQ